MAARLGEVRATTTNERRVQTGMEEQVKPTERPLGRRRFLQKAGIVGATLPVAGGLVISACYNDPTSNGTVRVTPTIESLPGPSQTNPSPTVSPVEAMDQGHEKVIEDFLANQAKPLTAGKGNQELPPTLDNGVKVFDLTADEVNWETTPGKVEKARGFNGMIPGPILRATEGDRVRINVKNNLLASTSVHWHGLRVPNAMDGVGYLTQDPIKPGESFTYDFTLRNHGSHMYHSHHDSSDQVNRGLLGAFIVSPKDPALYPAYDKEYILIMNDTLLGFTLNGKGFPATEALTAKKGERVLIRWMNEGMMYHPFHLHGLTMEVFARDGYPISPPYLCDTIDVPPGNRFDCIVTADEVGVWAFHCHVLSHAENTTGFFGLTTVMMVTE